MADFSPEELARCIEILEQLVLDRARLVTLSNEQRIALLMVAGRLSRPTRHEGIRENKAFRRYSKKVAREDDAAARAETRIRIARQAPVYAAPPQLPGRAAPPVVRELNNPRSCYVCKAEYRRLHFFYDSMCEECAELNYGKRFQSASLVGRTALITGARIKIGFQAALMMLRAGARVIVTTRFPRDAAQRFAREADFEAFSERLQIHGLDLRHCSSVELFARFLNQTLDRLDIVINNAAQTVRRPPGFYQHLLELELGPLSNVDQPVLVVQGELDTQVPPSNAERLQTAANSRKKARPTEIVRIPGVNHLLVPAATGEVDEYAGLKDKHVSPAVPQAITAWLQKTLAGRK